MKFILIAWLFIGALIPAAGQTAIPPFPGIRLQGTLTDNSGNLVTGTHNVTVRLYKHPTAGIPIYTELYSNLVFTNGILDVLVGASALPYDSLYYVETQLDNEVFSPRTQLASTPYALHAFRSDTATYAKTAAPDGPAGGVLTGSYPNPSLADSSIQFSKLARNGAAPGQVMKWNGTAWIPANDSSIGGVFLPLSGGVMTGAVTNVGNPPIAMGKGNFGQGNINVGISAFVAGSNNRALGDYSTVNGGGGPTLSDSNSAGGASSTIGGGSSNVIRGPSGIGQYSTIGGGIYNNVYGIVSVIGGGSYNSITNASSASVIAGGASNIVIGGNATICGGAANQVGGIGTIAGGILNTASAVYSFVGAGNQNLAAGEYSTIGGGANNRARGKGSFIGGGGDSGPDSNSVIGDYSVIAGGKGNLIQRTQFNPDFAFIGGGTGNKALYPYASVVGGSNNTAYADYTVIGGGSSNIIGDDYGNHYGFGSAILGGSNNYAGGNSSFVGGGSNNHAGSRMQLGGVTSYASVSGGYSNSALFDYSTVCGGINNMAGTINLSISSSGFGSFVGGGGYNQSVSDYATISGGSNNVAGWVTTYVHTVNATVGGGSANQALTDYSTISGGANNVAGRTFGSSYFGVNSSIGGGGYNTATGDYSSIPGGFQNSAIGGYTFAGGQRAKANHSGSFVWADSSNADFASSVENEYNVRATGGTRIFSNSNLSAGVTLAAGASAWSSVSDSTMKRNARVVNGAEILDKLDKLPIKQWSYKSQDPSIEHVGPMAQDFYAIYGLGENNKTISTIDPSGVALAAIQQLHKENVELKKRLAELESLVKSLGGTK